MSINHTQINTTAVIALTRCLQEGDPTYYNAAMEVIDLRCRHSIEPHTLIADGDEVFKKLASDWEHLRNETIH